VSALSPAAPASKATIDESGPAFKRSRKCGGLCSELNGPTPCFPGKIDWTGRISKCGDAMLRSYLFEGGRRAADPRGPKMVGAKKLGGMRLAKAQWGSEKGQSRRLARASSRSFCNRMWVEGTEFTWVEEGGLPRKRAITRSKGFTGRHGWEKHVPAGTDGGGEIARFFFASLSNRRDWRLCKH